MHNQNELHVTVGDIVSLAIEYMKSDSQFPDSSNFPAYAKQAASDLADLVDWWNSEKEVES